MVHLVKVSLKQKLPEESELVSDANLFIASLVPLKLTNELTGDIVWQNPVPSSVRFFGLYQ